MVLVVFVLDTSASMNQKVASGLSLLDCAKSAIEHFHKVRQRDAACRLDRYMLVTCEEGPGAIKVLDKYPFNTFLRVLKGIAARNLTNTGAAMQRTFDFLQLQRLANDVDRFGLGRNPCSIDPTLVMLLTDGTELTTPTGVSNTLMLPGGPVPLGSELSMQPFRWDQRVFATVLRMPSVSAATLERGGPVPQNGPISGSQTAVAMDSNISAFCEVTGGKCMVVTSWKALMQHMELMATRLQPCVVVSFEHLPVPGAPAIPHQVHVACQRKMVFVRGGQQGNWPIPEAYWPDPSQPGLPPRDAHPTLAYKALDSDPTIPNNLLYDKYDVENNPITNYLIKGQAGTCWQLFVRNSKGTNHGYGDPFGYLRLNRTGNTLSLFVLPYNYPVLFGLLQQLPAGQKHTPDASWRASMERYCAGVPPYYCPPLRNALKRWGLPPSVVPDSMDAALAGGYVGTQLKRLKQQAKGEVDKQLARLLTEHQSGPQPAGTTGLGISHILPATRSFPPMPTSLVQPDAAEQSSAHGMPAGHPALVEAQPPGASVGHKKPPGDQPLSIEGLDALVPTGPTAPSALPGGNSAATQGPAGAGDVTPGGIAALESAVFQNPFDHQREDILRLLFVLPLRVAMAVESRQGAPSMGPLRAMAAQLTRERLLEARHSLPIEKMGDFNEALSRQQPPRNPMVEDNDRSKLRGMFGNPYRQEKSEGPDEAWLEGAGMQAGRGRKRRRPGDVARGSPSPPASPRMVPREAPLPATNAELPPAKRVALGGSRGAAERILGERTLAGEGMTPGTPGMAAGMPGGPIPLPGLEPGAGAGQSLGASHSRVGGVDTATAGLPRGRVGPSGAALSHMEASSEQIKHAFSVGANGPPLTQALSEVWLRSEGEGTAWHTFGRGLEQQGGGGFGEDMGPDVRIGDAGKPAADRWHRRASQSRALEVPASIKIAIPRGPFVDSASCAEFTLGVFRTLRNAKAGRANELLDILALPDLPIDKPHLVRQLVVQAQRFRKHWLAEELMNLMNRDVSVGA